MFLVWDYKHKAALNSFAGKISFPLSRISPLEYSCWLYDKHIFNSIRNCHFSTMAEPFYTPTIHNFSASLSAFDTVRVFFISAILIDR